MESVDARPRGTEHRRWGPVAWLAWGLGATAGLVAALGVVFLVSWRAAPGCGSEATTANVRLGLSALGWAAAILGSPWLIGAAVAPKRWRPMAAGLVLALAPLAAMALTHTRPESWDGGGFCF
jgi:hypothetical protein